VKNLVGAVVALLAVAVPAASANAPTVVESFTDRTVTIPAGADTCPFPIVAHLEGARRVTTFFDRDGNVVRRTILLQSFTITYTNPLSGESLSTSLAGPVIGEPQPDGTWLVTIPGNDGRFVAPGEGIIFANVGLRIGFQDGPLPPVLADEFFKSVGIQDASEFPAVCAPLS
jgi:hypothetical protein